MCNGIGLFKFLWIFPTDIRLDWETYNIVPQDNQLLDMLVFIGQPLPVIKDGQEVVPAVQEEDCYRCEEKPFIQVKLREHEGERAKRPFDVTPSQQVWQTAYRLYHGYTSQNGYTSCNLCRILIASCFVVRQPTHLYVSYFFRVWIFVPIWCFSLFNLI